MTPVASKSPTILQARARRLSDRLLSDVFVDIIEIPFCSFLTGRAKGTALAFDSGAPFLFARPGQAAASTASYSTRAGSFFSWRYKACLWFCEQQRADGCFAVNFFPQ